MRVRVLFFGILKNIVGKSEDVIELLGGRVSSRCCSSAMNRRFRQLKESLPSLALAVNQQYVGPGYEVEGGRRDRVAAAGQWRRARSRRAERHYASIVTEAIDTAGRSCRH